MTISERIKALRIEKGLTQEDFGVSIGIKRSNYAQIENGNQLPTLETISGIVKNYNISYSWIIDGVGPKYQSAIVADKSSTTKSIGIVNQVVDPQGMRLIPITSIQAAAGSGVINHESFDSSDIIKLPSHMLKSGTYLCIRIKGISMAPTLQDGGYAIIRLLEPGEWIDILTDRIYVVVDRDGHAFIKRIKNRLNQGRGFIVLHSDSPDKTSHPSFNLHLDEISFIWYVDWYFTAKLPNIHDQYYHKLSQLEERVDQLSESVNRNFK